MATTAHKLMTARTHYQADENGPYGLTQSELADRSGITAKTIGGIERGEVPKPSQLTLARLANALGTNVEKLQGEDESEAPAA